MPKYVVSSVQDETEQALDPDGANAKVSFNNRESSPTEKKSRINRGKWSTCQCLCSVEMDSKLGYITTVMKSCAYFDGCVTSHPGGVGYFQGCKKPRNENTVILLDNRRIFV
jgi:hypothetical protein